MSQKLLKQMTSLAAKDSRRRGMLLKFAQVLVEPVKELVKMAAVYVEAVDDAN